MLNSKMVSFQINTMQLLNMPCELRSSFLPPMLTSIPRLMRILRYFLQTLPRELPFIVDRVNTSSTATLEAILSE